jgi:ABC-type Fe3+/spermidine/putrescine transport system ATPase subunit
MATLALTGLTKSFGGRPVVDDVHLSVADGEFVCILGPSGCGKSTTLRMIGGFEEPTAGDVAIDGSSVLDLPPNRRPTAMVFQKYTLWPHMRVFENIAFGLGLRGLPGPEIDREVRESLSLVGLSGYERRYPAQLSGGEQQRVALARALVLKPKLLLLDEVLTGLTPSEAAAGVELIRKVRETGVTIVMVEHVMEVVMPLVDRAVVLHLGKVLAEGLPKEVVRDEKVIAAYLGDRHRVA